MSMSDSEQYDLLDQLAEEFAARFRRGERPALKEYTDRYPELADDIRELFPAMVKVEQVEEAREEITQLPISGPLPPLERLGDYRIIREVGRGGMGVVYEAEQVSLGRHVALKVLPKQLLVDDRTKQRFEREAKAAARLHQTNIVPVFSVGEHEGLPYYVMRFIQGLRLDEVLEELKRLQPLAKESGSAARLSGGELRVAHRDVTAAVMARSLLTGHFRPAEDDEATEQEPALDPTITEALSARAEKVTPAPAPEAGRLSDSFSLSSSSVDLTGAGSGRHDGKKRVSYWQSVARIGVQVANALQHAHAQGVLHRDIKPSNLLLDTAGVVWVTDFGLAKADDQKNLTDTGDIMGTRRYMAPEALDGRTDARADVYSMGLTLYELLAKRPAFDEKERNRLIKQVTAGEPVRLDRLNPDAPRDLVTIVQKAIDRDPAIFERIARLRPNDAVLWIARAEALAHRGDWQDAASAFRRLLALEPENHTYWYVASTVLPPVGDVEGYRWVCREMLTRFADTDEPNTCMWTAWSCVVLPDASADYARPAELAAKALAAHASGFWSEVVVAAVNYRAGRFEAVTERLRSLRGAESRNDESIITGRLILAMAYRRLGRTVEAGRELCSARREITRVVGTDREIPPPGFWHDWLRLQLLRHEAEELILDPDFPADPFSR